MAKTQQKKSVCNYEFSRLEGVALIRNRMHVMVHHYNGLTLLLDSMVGGEWDTPKVGDSPMDMVSDSRDILYKAIQRCERWIQTGKKF